MSTKFEKCSPQCPRAQYDVFKLFLLSKQQPKTEMESKMTEKEKKKVSNPHIQEAKPAILFTF